MKKNLKSPLIILALGVVIVAASSAGAARAALVDSTARERVNFSTAELSVDILENDVSLKSSGELNFSAVDEDIKVGKLYDENVTIVNNSNEETGYSEYVRVIVRKSWYKDGKKDTSLDPALIVINVDDGWIENKDESTSEQTVYYRTSPLACGESVDFINSIKIDNVVNTIVADTAADGVSISGNIANEYIYDGQEAYIQLQADVVQTHNAEDAIYAAWGVKATCSKADDGDILSINGKALQ